MVQFLLALRPAITAAARQDAQMPLISGYHLYNTSVSFLFQLYINLVEANS